MRWLNTDGDFGLRGGMVDARSGSGLGMVPRVVNVAVLDEKEPLLLVQRYYLPERVYQIVRKQTSQDEHFSVSGGVEIDRALRWSRSMLVDDDAPEEPLAAVFVDLESARPFALIAYDPDARLYYCDPAIRPQHGPLVAITSRNIDAAIARTVVELDTLLQKQWWDLGPWLSASWPRRLGMLLRVFFESMRNWETPC
jgi:hypothetical protein